MTVELRREVSVIKVPDLPSKASKDVAVRSAKELGYGKYSSVIFEAEKNREKIINWNRIHEMLATIDVQLLNNASVAAYKDEQRKSLEAKQSSRRSENRLTYSWESKKLGDYNDPIPEFVLARALQVKDFLLESGAKQVNFFVEYLLESSRETLDPFLYFLVDEVGWKFYLEVWDEPKFEGVRQV